MIEVVGSIRKGLMPYKFYWAPIAGYDVDGT